MMADVELSQGFPLFYPQRRRQQLWRAERARGVRRRAPEIVVARCWPSTSAAASGRSPIRASSPSCWPRPRSCPSPWRRSSSSAPQFVDPTPGRRPSATRSSRPARRCRAAEIIKPDVDVAAVVDALLQPSFAATVVAGHEQRGARAAAGRRQREQRRRRWPCADAAPASGARAAAAGRGRRHLGDSPLAWAGSRRACCRRPRRWRRRWPSCGGPASSARHSPPRCGAWPPASRSASCWRRCWAR